MQGNRIHVSIVEDDDLLRTVLQDNINADGRFECVHSCSSAEDLFSRRNYRRADVYLMDIVLPGVSGIEALKRLRRVGIRGQSLMLTNFDDPELVRSAVLAGAQGYLLKTTPIPRMLDSLVDICNGGAPISSTVARIIVDYIASLPQPTGVELLTVREYDVLRMLSQRRLYKEIAVELEMSLDTVRTHVRSIYNKLNVHRRVEAERIYRLSASPYPTLPR
jgi:DNA-binding NarL/FixJ family response regulator